ncbi:endonuclease [Streptomyces piniterrae]|uniref:Endonuclease n=1 Tax=Streptomyces piniterrae TaxID=2571125 RepID=A0A4U0MU72_9ACTN|nr:endonuclease/exonuclease/phosphatase family protein [Streptomyces piniterrae]TJZ44473.1 endonuclease [Streptomyces piniterrae]
MTRNVYIGADLSPVFHAINADQLIAGVDTVFRSVQATDFPARAEALAGEIAGADPHLVSLQEVALWRSRTPADLDHTPNATDVEFDFLEILLDRLAARGKHYEAVATAIGGDYEAPRRTAVGGLQDIRLTDRDVLLARTDLPEEEFSVAHAQADRYEAHVQITSGPLSGTVVPRGWVAADVTVHGHTIRVVGTHLEPVDPAVQMAQGRELLDGPLDTTLPRVLAADLNSAADGVGALPGRTDTRTHHDILAAGFTDAWTAAHDAEPGFTCCRPADLRDGMTNLGQRIDYVLFSGALTVLATNRVGEAPGALTPSGLWPSDHAGVWSVLQVH